MNKSVPFSAKQQREITTFTVLMNTWEYKRKSLGLCIYFDSAQTNPVAGFFVNIVKCEQDGIIAKKSQLRKRLFLSDVFLAVSVIIAKLGSFSIKDGNGNDNATN